MSITDGRDDKGEIMRKMVTALALGAFSLSLVLLSGGSAVAQHRPRGSYMRTCRNIRMEGGTLFAMCEDRGGHFRRTMLRDFHRCRGDISNDNGRLRCRR
ncbi:hypothetical protein [Polyangium jinanense]|uniref:Cyanovirin-N domain-containing protein n=1 Tax=Polyangium jinanense TaxID=2829994 RepID=A0A9X3WZP8_9BACT|nr:hypothetical protein [Polyangium jinanense]MDC3953171.1 hypothetical protein [Polyangium jinanense]MDC3979708.1 hypothetical protein [Polyangium jinanense]